MSSPTPKKRSKSKHGSHSSSSASKSSLTAIIEPPQSLLPSKGEFLRLIAVLAIASAVALSCNFFITFSSSTSKPFCDNLDPTNSFSDACEPCLSNGECYEGKLECINGYRRHGKLCIEDRDINETAKKLSKWVEAGLCEAYAQVMCYGTGTVWVQENGLWNDLDEHMLKQNVDSDHTSYVYTKRKAMETIAKLLETRTNLHGLQEFKCPDALAEYYKPLTCRIRELVSKHALIIVPVCAALIGCAVLFWKVRQRRYLSARAEELYNQVCDMLEENALRSKSMDGGGESWVVASWLRDHLLLPRERKDPQLWKKYEELLQDDSRVDRYPKLVKGESKVVCEWQVEGSLSSVGKRKREEGVEMKSGQTLKAEPKALIF
ncbi:Vacuolar protein sorting 55 (VPS55) family protein isoform 1 [Hibiscus syriacus]|uniref:Vacuolar protein sorting 55 (VPS55) family protein isoform 1 n=1 Tax=Hibiscus syriacus TaxID=106335 RepID=A0A6A3CRX4_HIBSY|nr:Vacuolar protein sorting 55 (VPS55) family protein isoform 1 [Hibiscus syriacus]